MKNPCRECEHLTESKNDPKCTQCDKRIEYVRSLGGANDMQPLLGLNGGGKTIPVGADYDAGKDYKEMGEPKICSKADCEHGGEPQALDNFYKGASMCKDCFRDYEKKKKQAKKIKSAEIIQGPAIYKDCPYTILIDLSETPELYRKLAEREAASIIRDALR